MDAERILEKARAIHSRYVGATSQDLWWIAETVKWETRCRVENIGLKDDGTLEMKLLVPPDAFPEDARPKEPAALWVCWSSQPPRPGIWQRVKSALFGHE
jgi:hypothetical protein